MNYQGDESIYIYARLGNTLTGGSVKRMWTYTTDEHDDEADNTAGRPRLMAKFGDQFLPVLRRAGRRYIVVGDAAAPQPPRPATVEEAIEEMAARGIQTKPELAKRLGLAADLARDGRVTLVDDAEAQIGPYRITPDGCTCADFRHRGGWCKHRLAVRMARHLVRHGFTLPEPVELETCPQISAKNLALINSNRVIDEARRRELAYQGSSHAARDKALRMMGNGAGSLPADLARRVGIVSSDE